MPVTVKDIPGFSIEKIETIIGPFVEQDRKYNEAIDLQGQVKLGLNRESLALHIYYAENRKSMCLPFKDLDNKNKYYEIADAIIANEATLLEVVK
jgi:hypothetical protein